MATGTAEVYINDAQAQNALKQLSEQADKLNKRLHEMKKANDLAGHSKAKKELDQVNKQMKAYTKTNQDLGRVLDNLSGASYNELVKVQRRLRSEMKGMKRDTEDQRKAFEAKAKQIKKVDKELTEMQATMRQTNKVGNTMGTMAKKLGPALAAAFSIGAMKSLLSNVINVRKEFEKYEAVLTNTLGSKSEAQKSLAMIQDFASKTPFSVMELSDSFVALANMGFKPTREEMTKLGDLASSTGRSFNQMAGALIAAQTGEYERLKAFGIVARVEGNKVQATFKGVTTELERTGESMRNYLLSLGEMQGVSGSMAAISETLGGKISNLGDAWEALLNTMGELSGGIIGNIISGFSSMLSWMNKIIEVPMSESLEDERMEINSLFSSIASLNEGNEARARLLNELKLKYPEYLENIDTEKITNQEILELQKQINEQFMQRIQMAVYEEQLTALFEKGKEAKELELNAIKNINDSYEKYIKNKKEGLTLEQKLNALQNEDLTNLGEYTSAGWDIWEAQKTVRNAARGAQTAINESIAEQNKLTEEYNAILENQLSLKKETALVGPETFDYDALNAEADENEKAKREEQRQKEIEAQKKLNEEKKTSSQKYYDALAQMEDQAWQNTLSRDERELLAISRKYEQLYLMADQAGLSTAELEAQHAEELAAKQLEIENRTQQEILNLKRSYGIDITAELMDAELQQLQLHYDNKLLSEEEFQQAKKHIQDKYTETQEKAKEIEVKTEKLTGKQKLQIANEIGDASLSLLKEGSEEHKIVAATMAMINAIAASVAALSPPPVGAGPILGIPIAAAAFASGIANVAKIRAQQFASGKYDVIGADDGKTYSAGYEPAAKTGIYQSPTLVGGLGLVGEKAPELVIDGDTLRNIQINYPAVIDAINMARVPQFAAGNYPDMPAINIQRGDKETQMLNGMMTMLNQMAGIMQSPLRAHVVYTDIKDADDEMDEIKNNVSK